MKKSGAGRGQTGAILGGLALIGTLLFAGQIFAQGDESAPTSEQTKAQIAEILDRHSNVDEATTKLGSATYQSNCAACHDNGVDRAPPVSMLGNLSPEAILRVITEGQMRVQASTLSTRQKQAVAEFLTGHKLGEAGEAAKPMMCKANTLWFDLDQPPALAGWGLDPSNAHSIPGNVAGLDRANVAKLKLKWTLAFSGVLYARSQPAIAGGTIFVGGDDGKVYALDPETGCAHWTFTASGPVRQGIVVSNWKAGDANAKPLVYFGDILGKEYALDAATGRIAWQRKMDAHPNATLTGSPALSGGMLYVPVSSLEEPAAAVKEYQCCTFRGSVVALDAKTGAEKWRSWMVGKPKPTHKNENGIQQFGPSGVAIWATPMVDPKRGQLYVVTGDNYSAPTTKMSDSIVAVDLETGKINWSYQATSGDAWNVSCGWADDKGNCPKDSGPDHDFGAGAIMAKGSDGKDHLLAGQKSGSLFALDPDTGKLQWAQRVGRGGTFGGIHFGIAAEDGKVFVPVSDLDDGGTYDRPGRPGVFALDVATGKPVWGAPAEDLCGDTKFCHPGYGAAISVTPGLVLAGAMDGHLRIFDADNGKVLWDTDTNQPFKSVNGAKAHGGSFAGGAAPIAWHGKLIVPSGYGGLGKMPGNVLLVYDTK
jgi:polyvinyl alcohol dehydrogenase (cytochrome)